MNSSELRKWREAHGGIDIPDAAIAALGSFPSLYANDLADKLANTNEHLAAFVRALMQECSWAYDGWTKAKRDADAKGLLADIYTAAGGSGEGDPQNQFSFVRRFLVDYALANNLPNPAAGQRPQDDWSERLGLVPLGTAEISGPSGVVSLQAAPRPSPTDGSATVTVFSPDASAP
jgi:hypothetical protein